MARIHLRAEWGFDGWDKDPYTVDPAARTEYMLHWEGSVPTTDSGAVAMRNIHAYHKHRGWAGIGYNYVVFQDGSIWEGRGPGLVGAHCPGHNRAGYGVQIHVGGDQRPSREAFNSAAALYGWCCNLSGRPLQVLGHRDGYPTDCPGNVIEKWLKNGMVGSDMELTDRVPLGPGARAVMKKLTGTDVTSIPVGDLLQRILGQVLAIGIAESDAHAELTALDAKVATMEEDLTSRITDLATAILAADPEQDPTGAAARIADAVVEEIRKVWSD